MKIFKNKKENGMIIIQTIVFSSVAVIIIGALSSWAGNTIKSGRVAFNREQALQSAEAGIEYYRWHLAHAPSDYQDGTGGAGPYIHSLKDKMGNTVGQFSLTITPPSSGSTLVKIKSSGTSSLDSSFSRKILSQVAKPSIAENAFVGNDAMRFGEGTEIFGSIHSNGGIRFDGYTHNVVSSGFRIYDDADHFGLAEIGVHTHVRVPPATGVNDGVTSETNANSIPNRTDVFAAGRRIEQPTIDFSGFTGDIANLKTASQSSGGFYRDISDSGFDTSFVGYHIVLKTDDTFDLYKINSWVSMSDNGCITLSPNNSSWSIDTQTLQGNYAFPANGIIFLEDHVVVDGQIDNARLTIVAASLPEPSDASQYKNIIINNDLLYTNYNGTDSLGLVGQGGVMVGMISEDNLKIDGALMAQRNKVGRFYYGNGFGNKKNCVYKNRNIVTLYGMIASYARYGFTFTNGTGYTTRNINYDGNLLYAPPPLFPLTSDQYKILSWQEVRN